MLNTGGLIVGHLVGDYLFQNDWMAMNKKKPSLLGFAACLLHCLVYSACVVVFLYWPTVFDGSLITFWQVFVAMNIAFWSHFVIDRTYIVDQWMTFFGQTTWATLEKIEDEQLRNTRKLYVPLVQIAIDNTAHIALMYLCATAWL